MVSCLSLVLAIEISNPSAWTPQTLVQPGVAVGRLSNGTLTLIATEAIDPAQTQVDDLLPAIDRIFTASAIDAADIARVAVSIGPGGFTATRIAVTAAKCIAEATGAQCVGVPSAAVAFASCHPQGGQTLVLLSAKGESFYCVRYGPSGEALESPAIVQSAELKLEDVHLIIADRFAPESLRIRAAAAGIQIQEPVLDPRVLLAIEHRFATCKSLELAPIYPREPEAVTKWRELKRLGKK